MKLNKAKNSGFTLIEILIAVAIFSMLVLYMSVFQKDLFSQNSYMQRSIISEQSARSSLKRMMATLRSASPANDGSYPIGLATASAITYYSDIDQDGMKEKVRYYLASSTLYRGTTEPTGTPAQYLSANEKLSIDVQGLSTSSPIFSYYDSSYDGIGSSTPLTFPVNIPSIRLIDVSLSIPFDPKRPAAVFTSQVELRNLKDN